MSSNSREKIRTVTVRILFLPSRSELVDPTPPVVWRLSKIFKAAPHCHSEDLKIFDIGHTTGGFGSANSLRTGGKKIRTVNCDSADFKNFC